MHPKELWRHRKTRRIVRIEMRRQGLLSFSLQQQTGWVLNPHIWVEGDFLKQFERVHPYDLN